MYNMTSSDIIATCSLVVAALALIATFWQGWLTHRHNRLSVRPLLVWHIDRRNCKGSCSITFLVKNLGIGPAVIKDRYFTKDNSRFNPNISTDEVGEFLKYAIKDKIKYELKRYGLPGKGSAIPSQVEFVVAEIDFPELPGDKFWSVNHLLGGIDFRVDYESMYKEPFDMKAAEDD